MIDVLAATRRLAPRLGQAVYLVGGLVRDLLLERPGRDLDLVVEGDAGRWARGLAAELGGTVLEHRELLTATLELEGGLAVDVVRARSEVYRSPAALPEVEPGDLRSDLGRRDFTINAMAIRLWPAPAPALLDLLAGRRDLELGALRVLHERSFFEDPTRLPRAVGLELRLGFHLDAASLEAWHRAREAGAVAALSGSRLRAALGLLFDDPELLAGSVARLAELRFLEAVSAQLAIEERPRPRLEAAAEAACSLPNVGARLDRAAWLLLVLDLPPSARRHLARRLDLQGRDVESLVEGPERVRAALAVLEQPAPVRHRVAAALGALTPEELIAAWAVSEAARGWIVKYLGEWRSLRLGISGLDLEARGIPAGPALGSALRGVREARIDGKITAAEELELALRLARRGTDDDE